MSLSFCCNSLIAPSLAIIASARRDLIFWERLEPGEAEEAGG